MHSVVLLSAHDLRARTSICHLAVVTVQMDIEALYAQTSIDVGEHQNFS
jgi:hypothetical protein